ncbi:MAG: DUF1028 domain-containing protein [Acidobacteriaceae bacterium]
MKTLICFALLSVYTFAQQPSAPTFQAQKAGPLAHTFSIVARDPATGEIGVAVQSHWFAVGAEVPWARAGIGAVATQSFVDPSYGPKGLDLMENGLSAHAALWQLLKSDKGREVRQIAFIDAHGHVAAMTGNNDIKAAGDQQGHHACPGDAEACASIADNQDQTPVVLHRGLDYSVQANMMLNDKVWPAMAKAFESAKGDLATRMLAALDAGQAAGGDVRGRQSAALIVVSGKKQSDPSKGYIFNLRVDDSPQPLVELRRLVRLQRAYNHMNAGDLATEHHDMEGALREYAAADQLLPVNENPEPMYWHAIALVNMGRVDEALPLLKQVYAVNPNWRELTKRLPAAGQLNPKYVERITTIH